MATRSRRAPRPARFATLTAATAVSCLLAATLIAAPAQAARPAQAPAPIQPLLLPGTETVVTAADVSPDGVIVGTAGPADPLTNPTGSTVHRWLSQAAGYTGQELPSPEGATGTWTRGVTDRGEAGGTAVFGATRRATRWSADGRQPTPIGAENSETSAVGPGQWLVDTAATPTRTAEIVAPGGGRTPISGITDPRGRLVGGPATALIWTGIGTGILATALGFSWQAGSISFMPTVGSVFTAPLCYSQMRPDGTVAFSGSTLIGTQAVGIQRGGTTALLPTAGLVGRLGCENDDTMAADGWIAGSLAPTDNQAAREPVLWRPDRSLVRLGRATDETAAVSVAVATGGRAVVRATLPDGASRLVLWRQGVRTPLALPAGWSLAKVVELTDTGVVVANLTGPDGRRCSAVWRT